MKWMLKSTERFISQSKLIHGEKYDYSKVIYIGSHDNVIITCPIHGEFNQTPTNHLSKRGCAKCNKQLTSLRITFDDFITRSIKTHGNKYQYNKEFYTKISEKTKINCLKHGYFWQDAFHHSKGNGCPKCKNEITKNRCKLTTEEFIKRAKQMCGDGFDFGETEYINAKTKVKIICKKHGEYFSNPYYIIKKRIEWVSCLSRISRRKKD